MPTPANPADSEGHRPIPDPTVLTTESLLREIAHLKELLSSRIESNEERLGRIEQQRVEHKADTKAAVDSAFQAQKEAVGKSEASFKEQVAAIRNEFQVVIAGLQVAVNDLKDRTTKIEATKAGGQEAVHERQTVSAGLIAAGGLLAVLVTAALAVAAFAVAR